MGGDSISHANVLTFGDVLRRFRRAAGLTQEELAERARVSVRGISNLERAITHVPRRDMVLALADALELSDADRASLIAAGRRRHINSVLSSSTTIPPSDPTCPIPESCETLGAHDQPISHALASEAPPSTPQVLPTLQAADRNEAVSETAPRSPTARTGVSVIEQRRLVTVVVAGLSPVTAERQRLDPEDLGALSVRYLTLARDIIPSYGGMVKSYVGGAVTAIFGLPRAYGDDAERALAAALALRDAVAADPLLAQGVDMCIGVCTGEVVQGDEDSQTDRLLNAHVVSLAVRLYQNADPGEILAGERTKSAANAAFQYGSQRLLAAKGRVGALPAFPVMARLPNRRISRPPLVGRKQELAQLALLYQRVVEEQRPQLVSVVAQAGTGKTRVIEEFLAQLDPTERARVAFARCPPYGQALTYRPLRNLLSDLVGGEVQLPAVADVFARAGHASHEAVGLARRVLATLGLEPGAGEQGVNSATGAEVVSPDRDSVFQGWRMLFEALAGQLPRVLVFEDLHWASDDLLDLVEYLMPPRLHIPLFILTSSRPELIDRRPGWGGGRRSFTHLALEPLSPAHTRALVGSLREDSLQGVAQEGVLAAIVERSGGNPFFAIELVSGLAAQYSLRQPSPEQPVASLSEDTSNSSTRRESETAPTLPDTIQEAIFANLDLLPFPELEMLQVAAVAGRIFRPPMLQAVLKDVPPATVNAALEDLLARELVVPAEAGTFTFRHMLFREVTYGMLSRAGRLRLHAAIADWLEQFSRDRPDEYAEVIAYHYREALQLAHAAPVPLEAPFSIPHAVSWLVRAGELASRVGAFSQAIAFIRSAIACAPADERLRLYELLGDCAAYGEPALEGYRTALQIWRGRHIGQPAGSISRAEALVGARLARKMLTLYLSAYHTLTLRLSNDDLAALRAEAGALATRAGNEEEKWHIRVADLERMWVNAEVDMTPAEAEASRPVALAAARYFERRGNWTAFNQALDAYTAVSFFIGAHEEAVAASRRRLASPVLSANERAEALSNICKAYYFMGNYAASLTTAEELLNSRGTSDRWEQYGADGLLWGPWAAYESGHWSALTGFFPTLEALREMFDRGVIGGSIVAGSHLPVLQLALAREDEAAAHRAAALIDRALPKIPPNGRSLVNALMQDDPCALTLQEDSAYRWHSWMLLFLNEHDVAAPSWLIGARNVYRFNVTMLATAIAEALAKSDDERLAAAVADAEAHGMVPHAARMRIVLAKHTGEREQLERARPVLEGLGDLKGLRMLETVAATL